MIVLVLGPNGSGKSLYAEKIAARLSSGELYYIATMIPWGDEGQARVEKHRRQREALGFTTVEKPYRVSETPLPADSVVLLEDVSNLLGNTLFGGGQAGGYEDALTDIKALCAKCRAAVLVSIDGLTAIDEHDEETRDYIEALDRLNRGLFDLADTVAAMRGGRPEIIKGDAYALD